MLFKGEVYDDDGYPTEELLDFIKNYNNYEDPIYLMELVCNAWSYPEFIEKSEEIDWSGKPVEIFSLSTGGWSGNESLIHSLENNLIWWGLNWFSSQRGGHYVFKVRAR